MHILEGSTAFRVVSKKGFEKDIEKGIHQGVAIGIEQTAQNMLYKKMEHRTIQELTGVSIERLKELEVELRL